MIFTKHKLNSAYSAGLRMLFFAALLMCSVMFFYTSAFKDPYSNISDDSLYAKDDDEMSYEVFSAPGSYGDEVRQVQRRLSEIGLYAGEPDGIYSARLSDAVMKFQRSRGISPDGVCGPATLVALGIYTPPVTLSYRVGMSGGFVMRINRALAERGYLSGSLGDRYTYDISTANAVRSFQSDNGFIPNGICDNAALEALGLIGSVEADDDGTLQSQIYAVAKFVAALGIDDYAAQCAAAAVVYNRCENDSYPDGIYENLNILYDELKLDISVCDHKLKKTALDAAYCASQGFDTTGGAVFIDKDHISSGRSKLLSIGKIIFSAASS